MSKPDRIAQALEFFFGVRCPDFDGSCPTCQAWEQYDQIIPTAKAEERGACAALATNFAVTSNTRDVHLAMQEAASADTAEGIAAAIRKRGGE